jgi:hypothetical protein
MARPDTLLLTRKAKLAFCAYFLPPDEFYVLRRVTAVDPLDLAWVGILAEHLAGATRRRHSLGR